MPDYPLKSTTPNEIVSLAVVYAEQLCATGSPAAMRAALDPIAKAIQLNGEFHSSDTMLTFARQVLPELAILAHLDAIEALLRSTPLPTLGGSTVAVVPPSSPYKF